MKIYTWNDIAEEQLNPLAGRKTLHGTAITVAHFRFDKGNKVALHHHANDQVTMVEKARCAWWLAARSLCSRRERWSTCRRMSRTATRPWKTPSFWSFSRPFGRIGSRATIRICARSEDLLL